MRKYLMLILLSFPVCISAQIDSTYMKTALAVPVENGQVVFSQTIKTKKDVSQERLFKIMQKWANDHYKGSAKEARNRVALVDSSNGTIACLGDKLFSFERSMSKIDETNMYYQLYLKINANQCEATITKIKYRLLTGNKQRPEDFLTAEEMITDKEALKENGDFKHNAAKFRVNTVNYANGLFKDIDVYLNGQTVKEVKGAVEE